MAKKKVEPHIIIRLKITKQDIEEYLKNKMETSCSGILQQSNIFPKPFQNDEENSFGTIKNDNNGAKFDKKVIMSRKSSIKKIPEENGNFNINYNINYINLDDKSVRNNIPKLQPDENPNSSESKIKIHKCLKEFEKLNKQKKWPKSTNTWCHWCCHPFSGPPISLPVKKIQDVFYVTGCFCSYSCAASHLFSRNNIKNDLKSKYYELLHLLRSKILGKPLNDKIIKAPPKEILTVFGGDISIQEFRNITKETHEHHSIFLVLEPPMMSVIPLIEENRINSNKYGKIISNQSMRFVAPKNETILKSRRGGQRPNFIPVDKERMERAIENLRLRKKEKKENGLLSYIQKKSKKI